MPLLKNIDLQVSREEIGQGLLRLCPRVTSEMETEIDAAFEMAQPLLQPVIVYEWIDRIDVRGHRLFLALGSRRAELAVGENIDLIRPAQRVYLGVHSIGERLEDQVRELNRNGEQLLAYWLDSIGVVMLGKLGDRANTIAEEEAAQRGWGVGARLSPGGLTGWPFQDQKKLCALLPLHQAGLQVNAAGVIVPMKSGLAVVGIGPGYSKKRVQSVCHLCVHRQECWRRKY
jgi:hypothetical protein